MGGIALVFALSMIGMIGLASAATPTVSGSGVISLTYQIHNDADSGYTGGTGANWALDNFTQTLTLTPATEGGYAVSAVLNGTACTVKGDLSPQAGTPQLYSGCVAMNGQWAGTLSGSVSVPTSVPDVTNVGGEGGAATGGWESWFAPTGVFSGASTFNFHYAAPNDGLWIDSDTNGAGSNPADGDIIIAAPGAVTAVDQVVAAPQPVCALSVSSPTITFPVLYGGETVAPSTSQEVLVTNESTVVPYLGGSPVGAQAGVTVSGTVWYGLTTGNEMSVGQTTALLGATSSGDVNLYTSPFALSGSPSGPVVDLAPSGAAWLEFGLSVPSGQPVDTYSQTITIAPTC